MKHERFSRWPEALIIMQSIFEVTPVYTMMSVRYLIAFVVCAILFRKRIMETLRTVPVRMWLIPGMCIGLSYLLNNVALSMTDATSVAFLRSLSVLWFTYTSM